MNLCCNCEKFVKKVYNPFKSLIQESRDSAEDKFYTDDVDTSMDIIQKASSILENCTELRFCKFNDMVDAKSELTSIFLNVDGNSTNFDYFSTQLQLQPLPFSIIALAETNVGKEEGDLYQLNGYTHFYGEKFPNKLKGTGVCIYAHENVNATLNEQLCIVTKNLESLFITVDQEDCKVNIGVIYRPPSGDTTEFDSEFTHLKSTFPKNIKTILLGDYNFDLLKENNPSVDRFENMILSLGLFPLISLPTHSSRDLQISCIDNILTDDINSVTMSGVISDYGTHHKPLVAAFKMNLGSKISSDKKQVQFYSYSKKNVDLLVSDLESKAHFFLQDDPPPPFDHFFDTFTKAIDSNCKLARPKISKRNALTNPWITDGIEEAISNKDQLCDDWVKSMKEPEFAPHGDPKLRVKFRLYRKSLKQIIKTQKRSYYCSKISENLGNSKKVWEVINHLRGKSKKSIKPQFSVDGERIVNRRLIANKFNEYFNSIASKMNQDMGENLGIEPIPSFLEFLPRKTQNSMFLADCTPDELSKIIATLQNGKASDFPIRVIKRLSHVLSPILCKQFNNLMSIGEFPSILKIGKISPIFKKDNEELMENYRPVSTLPIFGKIFEKIIFSRLYGFLVGQGSLHDSQFGFREGHSTNHALNYSVHHIKKALKEGNHVLGIFIDLSKAFDTIDHNILLSKLENYGIRGLTHKLLKSYLTGRRQCVRVLGEVSDSLPVIYGVPQGSCLGPLLFLIYINDLTYSYKDCKFILFADDTNIFVSGKNRSEMYKKASKVLTYITKYTLANKLHINAKKSCYIEFRSRDNKSPSTEPDLCLQISGIPLHRVSDTKFLGVTIDENLNFDAHRARLVKKLATKSGILCAIRDTIPEDLYKNLYHTLFESHLAYGISVWGGTSNNKLNPIFKIQKRCIRILFGDKEAYLDKFKTCARTRPYGEQTLGQDFYIKEHTKPLFNKHKLLTVQNLYFYHCSNETLKILKHRTPISLFSLFEFSKRTGKETLLIHPQPSDSYIYRASVLWNFCRSKLLYHDLSSPFSSFKSEILKLILNSQLLGEAQIWNEPLNFLNCTTIT